jgi:predicted dehydrogenase
VEDDVTAILEYPNGSTGVFIASTGEAPGTNRLEITAERGRVVLENGKLSFLRNEIPMSEFCKTTQVTWSTPPVWNIDIPTVANNPRQLIDVIDAFANSILHGTPMVARAVEGINSLEIGNAILLSGLKKKSVDLPLDENEFSEMLAELVASSKLEKSAHDESNDFDFEKSQPK